MVGTTVFPVQSPGALPVSRACYAQYDLYSVELYPDVRSVNALSAHSVLTNNLTRCFNF